MSRGAMRGRPGEHHRGVGRHVAVRRVARRLDRHARRGRAPAAAAPRPRAGRARRAPAPSLPRTDPSPFPPMRLALAQDAGGPPRRSAARRAGHGRAGSAGIGPSEAASCPARVGLGLAALLAAPAAAQARSTPRRVRGAGRGPDAALHPRRRRPSAPSSTSPAAAASGAIADGSCAGGALVGRGRRDLLPLRGRPEAAVLALPPRPGGLAAALVEDGAGTGFVVEMEPRGRRRPCPARPRRRRARFPMDGITDDQEIAAIQALERTSQRCRVGLALLARQLPLEQRPCAAGRCGAGRPAAPGGRATRPSANSISSAGAARGVGGAGEHRAAAVAHDGEAALQHRCAGRGSPACGRARRAPPRASRVSRSPARASRGAARLQPLARAGRGRGASPRAAGRARRASSRWRRRSRPTASRPGPKRPAAPRLSARCRWRVKPISASGRRTPRPSSRCARSATSASGRGRPRPRSRSRWPRCARPRASAARRRSSRPATRGEQVEPHRHRHLGGGGRRRRAAVGGEVDQRGVGLVADGRDQRDAALGRGAHHDLLVEAPEVLEAAAAAGDDQQVRPRHRPARGERVEAADRRRDLRRAALALHRHRPEQHRPREALAQAVQDVADHRARGRGDDADHLGQVGQRPLARGVEQPLGGERLPALLQHRHQRADPGRGELLDDHLVLRRRREGGQPAGGDHLHALLAAGTAAPRAVDPPDHRAEARRARPSGRGRGAPRPGRDTRPTSPRTRTRPNSPSITRFTAPGDLRDGEFRGVLPRAAASSKSSIARLACAPAGRAP